MAAYLLGAERSYPARLSFLAPPPSRPPLLPPFPPPFSRSPSSALLSCQYSISTHSRTSHHSRLPLPSSAASPHLAARTPPPPLPPPSPTPSSALLSRQYYPSRNVRVVSSRDSNLSESITRTFLTSPPPSPLHSRLPLPSPRSPLPFPHPSSAPLFCTSFLPFPATHPGAPSPLSPFPIATGLG